MQLLLYLKETFEDLGCGKSPYYTEVKLYIYNKHMYLE